MVDPKPTGFATRQQALLGQSPYGTGQEHVGTSGITVALVAYMPTDLVLAAWHAYTYAARGGWGLQVPPQPAEAYMRSGLDVGLEAITYTFAIEGVSRACTHQLVRTRRAVIHQQTMRAVDMGNFDVNVPQRIAENPEAYGHYMSAIAEARKVYNKLADMGVPLEDARYVCPIATRTSLVMGISLREFANVYAYRGCAMTMHETLHVFRKVRDRIVGVHPFLEPMLKINCEREQRCTYRGKEETHYDCSLPWVKERKYKLEW